MLCASCQYILKLDEHCCGMQPPPLATLPISKERCCQFNPTCQGQQQKRVANIVQMRRYRVNIVLYIDVIRKRDANVVTSSLRSGPYQTSPCIQLHCWTTLPWQVFCRSLCKEYCWCYSWMWSISIQLGGTTLWPEFGILGQALYWRIVICLAFLHCALYWRIAM